MGLNWIDAGQGYGLALEDGKLVCRNKKGKVLSSVPSKVKKSEAGEQLLALRDWLADHRRECSAEVERWMLRSLPVPRSLLVSVWDDPAWRAFLENVIVHPLGDPDAAGFFKGVDAKKGIGVVDLDGESEWLDAESLCIPHPILLEELDDWRELAADLEIEQGIPQLYRETFEKPAAPEGNSISAYQHGKFEQLRHVLGKCRTLGYKVSGGFAVCPVWENGVVIEARYWIGADDPESEAWTGDLVWVDAKQRQLDIADVRTVAFSEGLRMASSIYAARVVEKEGEE